MKRRCCIILLAAIVWNLSCDEKDDGISHRSIPNDALRYVGYYQDSPCVEGWLMFTKTTPLSSIEGKWHLERTGTSTANMGPQVGDGDIEGALINGKLFLNLNPEWRDNNVTLVGTFDGEQFQSNLHGIWRYSGFAGQISEGTFRAEK